MCIRDRCRMDVKVLQYIMGHAHIDVTMEVYNHIGELTRIENEIARLAGRMHFTSLQILETTLTPYSVCHSQPSGMTRRQYSTLSMQC